MDIRKIDAILAARKLLKAANNEEDKKPEGSPPHGYASWEEFNRSHPRGADGRFGSGGGSSNATAGEGTGTVNTPSDSKEEAAAQSLGKDKPGYIEPDMSAERKAFEKAFPIKDDGEDLKLTGWDALRATQSLTIGMDLDPRTAGCIKDDDGKPLSLMGKNPDTLGWNVNAIAQSTTVGAGVGAVSGFVAAQGAAQAVNASGIAGARVTPGMQAGAVAGSMVQGAALGFVAGLIGNAIDAHAVKGILEAKNYAERMDSAGIRVAKAGLFADAGLHTWIRPNGEPNMLKLEGTKIAPGVYKVQYLQFVPSPTHPSKAIPVLITASATRRPTLEDKHSDTNGWDIQVTNAVRGPSISMGAKPTDAGFKQAIDDIRDKAFVDKILESMPK